MCTLVCVLQLDHHVDTTVVLTWEAAPAAALVNTMETVAMTSTVSIFKHSRVAGVQFDHKWDIAP